MKNPGLIVAVLAALALVAVLIRVAVGVVAGAANFVLGLFVVLALLALVVWMFAYAKKKRK